MHYLGEDSVWVFMLLLMMVKHTKPKIFQSKLFDDAVALIQDLRIHLYRYERDAQKLLKW
ncbi:hypothetical protein BCU60_20365 [Vibrio cyclitrophicus]|nr:hypothetical protein BCU60_20365 [Vibrio cyclitrophicus]